MSLAVAYSSAPQRRAVNVLIVSHFDSHGVSFAAARARVLRQRGEEVEIISKFPETGPQGLSSGQLKQLIDATNVTANRIEIIDIPIDVRNPDASVKTLGDLAMIAPVHYYDHHETDSPFVPRLLQAGITPMVFGDNIAMATALEIMNDNTARELAIIGMVADRDANVLKLVPRDEIECCYLPMANRLDMVVRNPRLIGGQTAGDVARQLAERGASAIPVNVEYPPLRLADVVASKIEEEGSIALLIDWSDQWPDDSQWTPKTLEIVLMRRRRVIAVAVTPGFSPRTRQIEGYDVRILRYWLAPADTPVPEEVAKEFIQRHAPQGRVVGHADYVSIRFANAEEALSAARRIFAMIEGSEPSAAHLVSDRFVAQAIRRDYSNLNERLTAIMENLQKLLEMQTQMYREYLELKRRQVELLEQLRRRDTAAD